MSNKFYSVMLIDDNEIDNLINHKMIESANISEHIYSHTSAKSALEFLKNLGKLKEYHNKILPKIIFLDIDMPMMDGFQFLDEFMKLSDEVKNQIKVIIVSSSINPKDISQSKKYAVVIKYLVKPLSKKTLENLMI